MGLGFSTALPPGLTCWLLFSTLLFTWPQVSSQATLGGEESGSESPQTSGHPQGLGRKWLCMGRDQGAPHQDFSRAPLACLKVPSVPAPCCICPQRKPGKAGEDPSHQTYLLPSQPSKTWDLDTWTCHRDSEAATCSTITLTESTWKEQSWGGGERRGSRGAPLAKGGAGPRGSQPQQSYLAEQLQQRGPQGQRLFLGPVGRVGGQGLGGLQVRGLLQIHPDAHLSKAQGQVAPAEGGNREAAGVGLGGESEMGDLTCIES